MNTEMNAPELTVVEAEPPNAETPLSVLSAPITPTDLVYIRCNFPVPALDAHTWRLRVDGLMDRPAVFDLDQLRSLETFDVTTVLECAGNGRRLMSPVPPGTSWGLGAVSAVTFTGVRLVTVLERCGLHETTRELVFGGADNGTLSDGRPIRFERSLPVERALHPDTLLAWSMNGEPLAPEHGFPLRLVVPGYYAMASVKWLERITAVATPFDGHFQAERYIYRGDVNRADDEPVTFMQVRSLIATPADGEVVARNCTIAGMAWSGLGDITAVRISDDAGTSWSAARLLPPSSAGGPTLFEYDWQAQRDGVHELIVRAEDSSGAVQPVEPVWNELGYANNVTQRVRVHVR